METLTLNTGFEIPQLGFGVFEIPPEDTVECVNVALDAGYRHIDTARIYDNEAQVGEALMTTRVPREEIFVTTKVWNSDQGYDSTIRAFETSMDKLGLEYLDLYLIHWPVAGSDGYIETWEAMESLHAAGRIRSIGVSNFQRAHLEHLIEQCEVVPAVNQIEIHPYLVQTEVRQADSDHGIATEAWSPLAQGTLSDDPLLEEIASKHGRSVADIALAWNLALDNVVLTRSSNPERIRSNFTVTEIELDDDEITRISNLDRGGRVGPHPETYSVA